MGLRRTIEWTDGGVSIIDQTKLPDDLAVVICKNTERVARAIETMEIRGAPAIGVAAAMGIALATKGEFSGEEDLVKKLDSAASRMAATRPTARNLFWAIERMRRVWEGMRGAGAMAVAEAVVEEAKKIAEEDVKVCLRIGENGARLLEDGDCVMTYCNAGALACVEHGTALGVIRSACRSGKRIEVVVPETRPLLQGARLTAYELKSEGIPFKLITDSMIARLMQKGIVDKVVVGADRITRHGDVVNKVGTCGVAIIARRYGVPFYVAAPLSTVDLDADAEEVAIEERSPKEVTEIRGIRIAPVGAEALNPAFDVTPKDLVDGIITEAGVQRPPFDLSLFFRQSDY